MNKKLQSLPTEQIVAILALERKKFLRAIDYGATGSDLEEIRDTIKELESLLSIRQTHPRSLNEKGPRKDSSSTN